MANVVTNQKKIVGNSNSSLLSLISHYDLLKTNYRKISITLLF